MNSLDIMRTEQREIRAGRERRELVTLEAMVRRLVPHLRNACLCGDCLRAYHYDVVQDVLEHPEQYGG